MTYEPGTVADVTITAGASQATFRAMVFINQSGKLYWKLTNGTNIQVDDERVKEVRRLQVLSSPKVPDLPSLINMVKDGQETWVQVSKFIERFIPKSEDTPWSTVTDKPEDTDKELDLLPGAIVEDEYERRYQMSLSGDWYDDDDNPVNFEDIKPVGRVITYGVDPDESDHVRGRH